VRLARGLNVRPGTPHPRAKPPEPVFQRVWPRLGVVSTRSSPPSRARRIDLQDDFVRFAAASSA